MTRRGQKWSKGALDEDELEEKKRTKRALVEDALEEKKMTRRGWEEYNR